MPCLPIKLWRRLIQLSWWEAVWHSKLSASLDSLIIKLYPPKPVCCLDEDSLYQYWKAKAFRSKVFEDKYILIIIYCSFYNFVMFNKLRPWIIKLVCCLMYCQILEITLEKIWEINNSSSFIFKLNFSKKNEMRPVVKLSDGPIGLLLIMENVLTRSAFRINFLPLRKTTVTVCFPTNVFIFS